MILESPVTGYLPIIQESKEIKDSSFITLDIAVFKQIKEITVNNQDTETWAFILDKDGVQQVVTLGKGDIRVSVTPSLVISKLRPFIEAGYKIIADFHNHSDAVVQLYQKMSLPLGYAACPSLGDLRLKVPGLKISIPELIEEEFDMKYIRIISALNPENGKIFINAFKIDHFPDQNERDDLEFSIDLPDDSPKKVKIVGLSVGNPVEMIRKKIIDIFDIEVTTGSESLKLNNIFKSIK